MCVVGISELRSDTGFLAIVNVVLDRDYHRIAPLFLTFLIWNIPPQPVDWHAHATGDDFSVQQLNLNGESLIKTKFQGGLFLTLQARR